jgi:hypothetical protein
VSGSAAVESYNQGDYFGTAVNSGVVVLSAIGLKEGAPQAPDSLSELGCDREYHTPCIQAAEKLI